MKNLNKEQYSNDKVSSTDPGFCITWKLLKNYRDIVWNYELSALQSQQQFTVDVCAGIHNCVNTNYSYSTNTPYLSSCAQHNKQMIQIITDCIRLLQTKHKHGATYYWVLYYTYLSPQELPTVIDVIDTLHEHIERISYRTYYRLRKEAIFALASVLCKYCGKEGLAMISQFVSKISD